MKTINKLWTIWLIFISVLFISSCGNSENNKTPEETKYESLTVISMNDNHGALEANDDNYGMAGIAWYINQQRTQGNAVLVISAGDMFQGTAISNTTYGLNMLEIMNDIDCKAMTIGNHEFDWGLETILAYVDGNPNNGEANFPFLGCNIIEKETNTVPEYVKEYEVVDFNEFQVGIIGYIGVGIESDISASKVAPYEFVDPTPIISRLAEKLRTEEGCELVIAMGHDASTSCNTMIASLSGDSSVDMIINGHTHAVYNRSLVNGNGKTIPVTQAGTASEYLTDTFFNFNEEKNEFETPISKTVNMGGIDIYPDEAVLKKIQAMAVEVDKLLGAEIGIAGRNVTRTRVSYWASDIILKYIECDLAVINSGGIRNSAFPIREGTSISQKKMYEIMPFDNIIKTCELTGQQLLNVLIITDAVFSTNVEKIGSTYYIDGEELDLEKVYVLGCVDYLFDREEVIYGVGQNIVFTEHLMRDLMIQGVKDLPENTRWLD